MRLFREIAADTVGQLVAAVRALRSAAVRGCGGLHAEIVVRFIIWRRLGENILIREIKLG